MLGTPLLFVAIAVAACFSPAQNDTWWHLRAGADAWRTGRVPLLDTFSHTAYGASWPNQEWLGEVVLYAAGSSARQTQATQNRPVDATIMAIVDEIAIDGERRYHKGSD